MSTHKRVGVFSFVSASVKFISNFYNVVWDKEFGASFTPIFCYYVFGGNILYECFDTSFFPRASFD